MAARQYVSDKPCAQCGELLNMMEIASRHARCNKCRYGKPPLPRAKCVKCELLMTPKRTAEGKEICYYCEVGRPKRLERTPGPKPIPKYLTCRPGSCQVCGNDSAGYTCPDGTNVPCCKSCFDAAEHLMAIEAQRRGRDLAQRQASYRL